MLTELIVIIVILATIGFVYLKGSVVKAFLLLINGLISSTAAFAFFETAGRIILGYGYGGQWVFGGSFIFIFILVFVLLNAMANKLAPTDIYFGDFPDRAIRSFIAIFAGLIIAGVILIAAALMPIGTKWPYERFNPQNKNISSSEPEPDKKLILNADGFTAGIASWFSRGPMSGKKSLAVFHPDFLNEIHLNRIGQDKNNLTIAGPQAIQVKAAWDANTEILSASDNTPLSPGSGKKIVIVQAGISSASIKDGGAMTRDFSIVFTMGQVRLLCKNKGSDDNLTGSAEIVYPAGFIRNGNIAERKNITDEIKVAVAEFSGGMKWYDFIFYIPADTVPVMLEFKLNAAAEIGRLVSGDKIPAPL